MANLKATEALAVRAAKEFQQGRIKQALSILEFARAQCDLLKTAKRFDLMRELLTVYTYIQSLKLPDAPETPSLSLYTLERSV